MNNIEVEMNNVTGEKVYKTVLDSGLKVYVYPRTGYTKKMGMFGTVFGSIDNEYIDVETNEKTRLPDGIAHFLEHKLFEQEDANALDVFAKMGVDSNAYTTFDHTTYYFETDQNYKKCLEKLLDFVSKPYFTDENVEKEKGIIGQEIKMYEDEPNAVVYYNMLKGMYLKHPINIDVAGTIETISVIDKEILYKCYESFYNLNNMFLILIGDLDIDNTINDVKDIINIKYNDRKKVQINRIKETESKAIVSGLNEKSLSVNTPIECIGFKLIPSAGIDNVKNDVISDIINQVCFSTSSDFFETLVKKKIITEKPDFAYESGVGFAHIIISSYVLNVEEFEKELISYLNELKLNGIDENMFNVAVNKKIGDLIYDSERMTWIYRSIIESILQGTLVFDEINITSELSKDDIDNFLKNSIDFDKMVISRVNPI